MRAGRFVVLSVIAAASLVACKPAPAPAPPPDPAPAKPPASKPKKAPKVVQTCDARWRGYVLPSDHNYAGIGAYSGSDRYMCKATATQGIRAQIQHLRNYADAASVSTNLGAPFEPRPKYDAAAFDSFPYKGAAPRWNDLEGKWAVPGDKYWDVISQIYNEMRVAALGPPGKLSSSELKNLTMQGTSTLSAQQIATYVASVGNPWKPEISPSAAAQTFIDEGAKAGIRGDVAFCQSVLETGWFAWPGSPSAKAATTPETTPDTTPGTPGATTPSTVATEPPVDVTAAYLELQASTTARN